MAGSPEAYNLAISQLQPATTELDTADIVLYDVADDTVLTPGLLMAVPAAHFDSLNLPFKAAGYGVARTHVYSRPDIAGDYEPVDLLDLPTDFRLPSCAGALDDTAFVLPSFAAASTASPTTYPNLAIILSRALPTPSDFVLHFLSSGFEFCEAKVGSVGPRMVALKAKLESSAEYSSLTLLRKGVIILDATLTATHAAREDSYWVGCPTHVDQLQAAITGMALRADSGDVPTDLHRVALAIASVVAAQDRVAKHVHENTRLTFTAPEMTAILRLTRDTRNETEQLSGMDWDTLIRYASADRLQRWLTLTRREAHDAPAAAPDPTPLSLHAEREPKEGHQTLTQVERKRLEDLLALGGTRAIPLQNAATLIKASGEEITGVKTAYFDISTTHTATTVIGHIARGMRTLSGESALRQIPNMLVLKLVTLRLDSSNWSLAHFGDVRVRDRALNATTETIELISGRVRMTKPPKHLWAAITSRATFGSAVEGVVSVVNRFTHPSIWSASEISDVLHQVDALHNDCGGHADWPLLERMFTARMAEHCEDVRAEIIKGTHISPQFQTFRDASEEMWETAKIQAREDCRKARLAASGSGLTRTDANDALRPFDPEFTAVSHTGDMVAPLTLDRRALQREAPARHHAAQRNIRPDPIFAPPPAHQARVPPPPPIRPAPPARPFQNRHAPNPDLHDDRKLQRRAPDAATMTCIRCGIRGHAATRPTAALRPGAPYQRAWPGRSA